MNPDHLAGTVAKQLLVNFHPDAAAVATKKRALKRVEGNPSADFGGDGRVSQSAILGRQEFDDRRSDQRLGGTSQHFTFRAIHTPDDAPAINLVISDGAVLVQQTE